MTAPARRPLSLTRKIAFTALVCCVLLLGLVHAMHQVMTRVYQADEARQQRTGRFSDVPGTLRLLFVGDSFTAGELSESGVGYWAYVPAALAARGYSRPVEVVSLAMAGSPSTWHYRQVLAWLGESGQLPDYLMVMGGANNWDAYEYQRAYLADPESREEPLWLHALYRLPRSTLWGLEMVGRRFGFSKTGDLDDMSIRPVSEHWHESRTYQEWMFRATAGAVQALDQIGEERGFTVLSGTYVRLEGNPILRAILTHSGVPLWDLGARDLDSTFRQQGWYTVDEWHPNDAGHHALAEMYADWLLAEVLEDAGSQHSGGD